MALLNISTPELQSLLGLVYAHTGIRMAESKKTLLEGRLQRRLAHHGLLTCADYIALVQTDAAELDRFIDVVTTHETYFARTPRVWNFFSQVYLPTWCQSHPGRTLKVWCAASSTGEEAYTVAMHCEEVVQRGSLSRYQVTASDISKEVLSIAASGQYGGRSMEKIKASHPHFYARYFTHLGDGRSQVHQVLRDNVSFVHQNLFGLRGMTDVYDVVFLRNVLIYFDAADQQRAVTNISRHVTAQGLLVLGETETITHLQTPYDMVEPLIYAKKRAA